MNDAELSAILIARLNRILESHPHTQRDIALVMRHRAPCSQATVEHPSLMAANVMLRPGNVTAALGLLGILNGIIGPVHPHSIVAIPDGDGGIARFATLEEALALKPTTEPAAGHWRCDRCWKDVPDTKAHRDVHEFSCEPAYSIA